MKNNNHELEQKNTGANAATSAIAGLVIGGLAGAGAALLFAPQSGKETRSQIQNKTLELRDRTNETVEGVVTQVKSKTHEITDGVREKAMELQHQVMGKADEIQHQGQEMLVDQLDRVAAAAEAGKEAIKHTEPEKPVAASTKFPRNY